MAPGTCPADRPNRSPRFDSDGNARSKHRECVPRTPGQCRPPPLLPAGRLLWRSLGRLFPIAGGHGPQCHPRVAVPGDPDDQASRTSASPAVTISVAMPVRRIRPRIRVTTVNRSPASRNLSRWVVREALPLRVEALQASTYSAVAVPDLALDPRLGGGPLDPRMQQVQECIEPAGLVRVEEPAAELSVRDPVCFAWGRWPSIPGR